MSLLTGNPRLSLPKKSVRFEVQPYNLKSLFLDFVSEKNISVYEDFIRKIRDTGQEIEDDSLIQLLQEARSCVPMLGRNLHLFVQVILILRWTHRGQDAVKEYQDFLIDLCTAHSYYTKMVMDSLVKGWTWRDQNFEWTEGVPEDKVLKEMSCVHYVLKVILRVVPMSQESLRTAVKSYYPYSGRGTNEHTSYVYNMLFLIGYAPQFQGEILNLLVSKLVVLDVLVPREPVEAEEDVFAMDVDQGLKSRENKTKELVVTLNKCLEVLLYYLRNECVKAEGLDWQRTKSLVQDMTNVFETVILPTHRVSHVQFVMFYLVSLKGSLGVTFIQMLWRKVTNPNTAGVVRQTALCYIASLVTRASFIALATVQDVLTDLASWIHNYIANWEGSSNSSLDGKLHLVFYSACQALFYVVAFRHRDLTSSQKSLVLLQNLNLGKIVTCKLNPLKYSHPIVTMNFATISRSYQLAYCYTILEHNARTSLPQIDRQSNTLITHNFLESFFPFDPSGLSCIKHFVESTYREYEDAVEDVPSTSKDEDQDDFLEPMSVASSPLFPSLASSPGFLRTSQFS